MRAEHIYCRLQGIWPGTARRHQGRGAAAL